MLIKKHVSGSIDSGKNYRGEKQIWQRRFWEHTIRDDDGYAKKPSAWRYSSFNKAVLDGLYESDWGSFEPETITTMHYE